MASRQISVYAAAGPMYLLTTTAVVLRFVARRRVKGGLWWDDWTILALLVILIMLLLFDKTNFGQLLFHAFVSLAVINTALYGSCRHIQTLKPSTQVVPYAKVGAF